MAIREILTIGDERLNKRCHPVTEFNQKLHTLLDDLTETLDEAQGVGLAAPQIGIMRRVVVVINENDEVIELVNPEIVSQQGEQCGPEGCLSVPGKFGLVVRPNVVKVRAQDRFGDWFEVEDEGLTARCFCHELEHLDGHLYVERMERFLTEEELNAYYKEQGYEIEEDS